MSTVQEMSLKLRETEIELNAVKQSSTKLKEISDVTQPPVSGSRKLREPVGPATARQ